MKKIVFLCHSMVAGGIESFLVNVFKFIDRSRYDITLILAIEPEWETLHEKELRDSGIKIIHICDLDGIKKKLKYFKEIFRIFKEENFDIVHGNMDLLNGVILTLAKFAGIKKRVCHAHTSSSQYKPQGKMALVKNICRCIYYLLMKLLISCFSTAKLSCSELAGKYFYGKSDSIIIYNGINFNEYNKLHAQEKINYLFKAFPSLPLKEYTLVSVGRISTEKNPLFTIDVLCELRKMRNDFRYIFIGNGNLFDEAKKKVNEFNLSDIVLFADVRNDVPQILCCCDCFLMPSLFEGLGIALIEAQVAGLNCLASAAVPQLADLGRTTFLPLDAGAKKWAEVINDMLDKPVPPLNDEKAKLFDIKYTVKQLEEIYDK